MAAQPARWAGPTRAAQTPSKAPTDAIPVSLERARLRGVGCVEMTAQANRPAQLGTGRSEAFSDGVVAVASPASIKSAITRPPLPGSTFAGGPRKGRGDRIGSPIRIRKPSKWRDQATRERSQLGRY